MESPVQLNPEATQSGETAAAIPKPTPLSSWGPLAWISGLMLISFYPMLDRLVQQWMNDDDMGHGFFVPIVAVYIAWQRKDEILEIPMERNYWR